ncbi:hypothetical protein B0H14DRAFT_972434 [Mycena olivaceomarginata]|nr:hypothetical protein B0H14DRAFT_972434 [Mycena olivaceomarginata]
MSSAHPELHQIKSTLRAIHESLSDFRPLAVRPPILDSSTEAITGSLDSESTEDVQWLQQESIPGVKQLRDSVKIDLDALEKFLDDPNSANLPKLSTNAPYLIAVWNEVLCGPVSIVSILKSFPLAPTDHPSNRSQRQRPAQKINSVKVDVVADSGRRWIRVNTIKNARILVEFREIDSYFTDSEDEDDSEHGPSLAQKEFDNSVLRMGRSLVAAANTNPIDTSAGPEPPKVTLRLTRLNPSEDDPRISQTIDCLRTMGIDVELGERAPSDLPPPIRAPQALPPTQLVPTANINLDLSVLIALVSDLTHAPLPASVEEAQLRFSAPQRIRESNLPHEFADTATPVRALTSQIMQEMLQEMGRGGMFQELHTRLLPLLPPNGTSPLQFWTTAEAHERFMRIVTKIGGPGEKQRAELLFSGPDPDSAPGAAETRFWAGSRYPTGYIPLLPVRVYPGDRPPLDSPPGRAQFFRSMEKTCRDILGQESPAAAPQKGPEPVLYSNNGYRRNPDSERATVVRANARLTAHTVQSMLWGAQHGWTTLTANKASVKALLREIRAARVAGRLAEDIPSEAEDPLEVVAIWILDPRA